MKNPFHGLITALITPFKEQQIDFKMLEKIIEQQITSGIRHLVIAGATGENSCLSEAEYLELIGWTAKFVNKEIIITAGINSNNTTYATNLAAQIEQLGIDGLMCTVPCYNKPTQAGLFQHFKHISHNTKLPIMIYSPPSRTGVEIAEQTLIELAQISNIMALKDCGYDTTRPLRLSKILPNFHVLAGDDKNLLMYYAQGAKGLVSVASNVIPHEMVELVGYCIAGNYQVALPRQQQFLDLFDALFIETNPIMVKYFMGLLGFGNGELRLPLTLPSQETIAKVVEISAMLKSL